MKFYHFSEMPYTEISTEDQDRYRGMRAFVPNKLYDPVRGYELYQRYLDEYELADELGFHLMLNEHHQSATGLQVSATMSAATIGARTRVGGGVHLDRDVPPDSIVTAPPALIGPRDR